MVLAGCPDWVDHYNFACIGKAFAVVENFTRSPSGACRRTSIASHLGLLISINTGMQMTVTQSSFWKYTFFWCIAPLSLWMGLVASGGGGGDRGRSGNRGAGGGRGAAVPTLALFVGNLDGTGNVDGTGTVVSFNEPYGVATDPAGNVYVADKENHTIRKITPAGVVSTFAGTACAKGSVDGVGTAASFNRPYSVATDPTGNVYVADHENHTIRKITPAGVVSTFAGSVGARGGEDGVGTAARFIFPLGVATDSTGNVYVVDGNNTIRKITPAGMVSTLAGKAHADGSEDGVGATARFYHPNGVATDHAGNVYVTDSGNHTIRKITPDGVVSTFAGTVSAEGRTDGVGAKARFRRPVGVATDRAGNVYVTDVGDIYSTIRKITPAGVVSTFAGKARAKGSAAGIGATAGFSEPHGVATDYAGNVYVADSANHTIRKITPAGVVSTFAGTAAAVKKDTDGWADDIGAAAHFNQTHGVATDSAGNLYVANDGVSRAIRKITPAGVVSTFCESSSFNDLRSVATDSAGNVYVTDHLIRNRSRDAGMGPGLLLVPLFRLFEEKKYDTLRKITPAGVVSKFVGESANFSYPNGVATDRAGNVYVADSGTHTIRKITPRKIIRVSVRTFAGASGTSGSTDGAGTAARFIYPNGVATDSADNIYVTDHNSIRKITPAGVVTTFAGNASSSGNRNGHGTAARFNEPHGVAIDRAGNVYVADSSNHTIRKITPAGMVSTFAGKPGTKGSDDGVGAAARFSYPYGVATDSVGNVYVTDLENSTLRKITPAGIVSTLAGTAGAKDSDDGVGAAARFYYPRGVATDSMGNVYVGDTGNSTVRKITPDGIVSTLAGADESGRADGVGATARFSGIGSVATDRAGNVYVADTNNSTVRKITPDGVVSTFAGTADIRGGNRDGLGAAAHFGSVGGVATDSVGNVYVTDTNNTTLRKITPAGAVSTFAGTARAQGSADGIGMAARFNDPQGVATDSADNVYVADSNNHTIRKITPAGVVSTFAGAAGASGSADGVGAAARFNHPGRMASDSAGNIYVVDSGNHTIRKITPAGAVSTPVGRAGQVGFVAGPLPGVLGFPQAVAVHGTSLYITMRNGVAMVTNLP